MLLAETSDAVQIAGLFFGAMTSLGVAWIGYLTVKARQSQEKAAVEVKDVKDKLQENTEKTAAKLDGIAKVGQMTHQLCNSAMLEQKRLLMVECQAAASKEPNDAVAAAKAASATQAYEDHKRKQAEMETASGWG